MTSFVKTLSGLSLIALAVVLVSAQEKVNFSGTWVLDKSQSDISQLMGLSDDPAKAQNASMTMVVEQQGSNLRPTLSRCLKRKNRLSSTACLATSRRCGGGAQYGIGAC
jgi:hypothetical protein